MKKITLLVVGVVTSCLVLMSACSTNDTVSSSENESSEKQREAQSIGKEEKIIKEGNGNKKLATSILNSNIEKFSEGKAEVVYNNANPNISIDNDGFKFDVEQYQVVHVTDIRNVSDSRDGQTKGRVDLKNVYDSFDRKREGYVITVKAKIDNQSGSNALLTDPRLIGNDEDDVLMTNLIMVNKDELLSPDIGGTIDKPAYYKDGETDTGIIEYLLSTEKFNELQKGNVKMMIPWAFKNNDMSDQLGKVHNVDFPLN